MGFWMTVFRFLMFFCISHCHRHIKHEGQDIDLRYVRIMPWATAMTIGTDVYIKGDHHSHDLALIHHEAQHIKQWQGLGFMFIPKYLLASLKALLKGKRPYLDNKFEVEAYLEEYRYRDDHNLSYINKHKEYMK